jgi:hypothetical protein
MKATGCIIVFLTWSLYSLTGFGQSIVNQRARVLDDNDLVEIKYALQGQKGEVYDVSVYGSHDKFAKPLISVTGDVGSGIEVGAEKTILWQPKTELESFKGSIIFEIKAELSAAPVSITNPNASSVLKRGTTLNLSWNGGAKQEVFLVQLLKNGIEKSNVDTVRNQNVYNNKFSWKVPADLRKGYDYQIKLTSTDRSNVYKQSPSFTIKPKLPLAVKGLPIAAGLAVGAYIIFKNKPLPGPPNAPR